MKFSPEFSRKNKKPTSKTYLHLLRVHNKREIQQKFNKPNNVNFFLITFAPVNLNNWIVSIIDKAFKGLLKFKRGLRKGLKMLSHSTKWLIKCPGGGIGRHAGLKIL